VKRGAAMPEGPRTEQFVKYSAAEVLDRELRSNLSKAGNFAEGGALELSVTATDFRLRSGGSAFWLSYMAGADFYGVEVEVKKNGRIVKTFRSNTSTTLGGIAYASPTKRTRRLSLTLSKRIANGL
jgi:hypothetical protein